MLAAARAISIHAENITSANLNNRHVDRQKIAPASSSNTSRYNRRTGGTAHHMKMLHKRNATNIALGTGAKTIRKLGIKLRVLISLPQKSCNSCAGYIRA